MNNDVRTKLIPIDVDWTHDMIEEISKHLWEIKDDIDELNCPIHAIDFTVIVQKHLTLNGYDLEYKH